MVRVKQASQARGITRICHFTQSRNLAHIFGDYSGVLSRSSLTASDSPHNPTDDERFDGRDDLICCSIEYPNVYYFNKVMRSDPLFKDWVVLYLKPDLIWKPGTLYCPCNAATSYGGYIGDGFDKFNSMFASPSVGKRNFTRGVSHLNCCPTDIQAEILVPDPISIDDILGIAVMSEEQAERENRRAELQGISYNKPIFIVPDYFKSATVVSGSISSGIRVREYQYGV